MGTKHEVNSVRAGDIVMVVERFAIYEGQIGVVEGRTDPDIWGDELWVVFGRYEPAINTRSDRLVGHYPPSSLLIIGMLTAVSDDGRTVLFDLAGSAAPA